METPKQPAAPVQPIPQTPTSQPQTSPMEPSTRSVGPVGPTPPPPPPGKGMSTGAKVAIWIIVIFLVLVVGGGVGGCFLIRKAAQKKVEEFEKIGKEWAEEMVKEIPEEELKELESEEKKPEAKEGKTNPVRPARDKTQVFVSSTLIDTTGIGFDYSSKQVLDQDFSTSWVEDAKNEGIGEWIRLDFSEKAKINTLGIVPGYARDTDIYGENNRLKSFELEFSDGTKITKTLPDSYGMHFVEFSTVATASLKLTIKDVYKGSKYNDTCVAELDIWSDYVLNKDAQAALNYYKKYKEPYALKPPEKYIINAFMTTDITETLAPGVKVYSYAADMDAFIASAQLEVDTPEGKTFACKWYHGDKLFHTEKVTSYAPTYARDKMYIASVVTISNLGAPYVVWPLEDYKVQWYEDGKLSRTVNFKVTAQ